MPQFLILADDHKDPAALTRRLSVREEHLTRVRNEKPSGRFILGGAKLDEDNKMNGSMLVIEAENMEAVLEWLSDDPYTKNNVWENIEIIPFKLADV